MAVIETVYSPSGQPISIVDGKKTGFNALDSEAFLKLMIVQLQNQDPTQPTSNEELLGQISQMRTLQSSIELQEVIKALVDNQTSAATTNFASSAASLIGRTVTGTTAGDESNPGTEIEGVVERAMLRNGKAYVGIGVDEIPVENITRVE